MPRIIVGVDAGGSSTLAAVAQDGELIRTHEGRSGNPTAHGVEHASQNIAETIVAALDGAIPAAIFVGAAGAGREDVAGAMEQTLQSRFPGARVAVRDDASIALRAAVGEGDGLVLIAGTGSVAYAERDGTPYRAGGYGYLLGDEGSAFAIGSAAIRLLLRAFDERTPGDALTQSIALLLQAQCANDVLNAVYRNTNAVAFIASLAPAVLEAANNGDRSANRIVQSAALELAETVRSLARRAQLDATEAPIVLAGGLLQENNLLTFLIETRLRNELPSMPVLKSQAEPFRGALAEADKL